VLGPDAPLGQLGGRTDQPLGARQLAQRLAADPVDGVRQVRVGEPLQDLVHVRLLGLVAEVVLGHQQLLGLAQHALDGRPDHLVVQGVAQLPDAPGEAVVGGGGVAGVDGEQLALDVRGQVVDPGGVGNGRLRAAEGRTLDGPLEVALDGDVKAVLARLGGHDAVDRGVGEHRPGRHRRPLRLGHGRADVAGQHVGRVDGVLTGHHGQGGRPPWPLVQPGGDHRGDELQHRRADRRGHDVG
jgi:hypothetical protein